MRMKYIYLSYLTSHFFFITAYAFSFHPDKYLMETEHFRFGWLCIFPYFLILMTSFVHSFFSRFEQFFWQNQGIKPHEFQFPPYSNIRIKKSNSLTKSNNWQSYSAKREGDTNRKVAILMTPLFLFSCLWMLVLSFEVV